MRAINRTLSLSRGLYSILHVENSCDDPCDLKAPRTHASECVSLCRDISITLSKRLSDSVVARDRIFIYTALTYSPAEREWARIPVPYPTASHTRYITTHTRRSHAPRTAALERANAHLRSSADECSMTAGGCHFALVGRSPEAGDRHDLA